MPQAGRAGRCDPALPSPPNHPLTRVALVGQLPQGPLQVLQLRVAVGHSRLPLGNVCKAQCRWDVVQGGDQRKQECGVVGAIPAPKLAATNSTAASSQAST